MRNKISSLLLRMSANEKGAEIIEVLFWIGVGLLAILTLIPQLRQPLVDKMNAIINAVKQ